MVWVGEFMCHFDDPFFGGLHFFDHHHMIVFPRTCVKLKLHGYGSLIGSPNLAVFYNRNTVYERTKLDNIGDKCYYFQFDPMLMDELLAEYQPQSNGRRSQTFSFTHALLHREQYLQQYRIVEMILRGRVADRLLIDETAVCLLENLLARSFAQHGVIRKEKEETSKAHRRLAVAAQELLAHSYDQPLTLDQIAKQLAVSPYHLSRLFRKQVGCTLHQFREQFRLRMAHLRIGDYADNLTQLALDVGYANHSHFTAAFHRTFGFPPSQWQKISTLESMI